METNHFTFSIKKIKYAFELIKKHFKYENILVFLKLSFNTSETFQIKGLILNHSKATFKFSSINYSYVHFKVLMHL